MNIRARSRRPAVAAVLTLVPALAAVCCGADQDAARQRAQQIFDETGAGGGLAVHLGCGTGELTAALGADANWIVQGLDRDAGNVARARAHIRALGRYGKVSVERFGGTRLPYADDLVNLVVAEDPAAVALDEMLRVLCPGGVAYVHQGEQWHKTVKPRPAGIDDWTHVLHGPDGNAVAADTVVGPPRHVQWIGAPGRGRAHEHLGSITVVVSAGGRLFSIEDEGPTASILLPARWFLVARDAFNGVVLWKKPVERWEDPLRSFRSGPVDLARRLVATPDRVYVTIGFGQPLQALDSATGAIVKTYRGTERTREIVYCDGVLLLVAGDQRAGQLAAAAERRGIRAPAGSRSIAAVAADSGELLWKKADADTAKLMPMTLAASGARVFFQNAAAVVCLDVSTGAVVWQTARPAAEKRPGWSAPTLVVYDDVVLSADRATPGEVERDPGLLHPTAWVDAPRGKLVALSARDGAELWSTPCRECFNAPVDVLVVGGLVWTGDLVVAAEPGITVGRDPHTGEIKRRRPADQTFFQIGMPHHRCHRNRATSRYLLTGRAGVEFIDVATGTASANHWVRGTCQFGTLPCNGLLYVPPHACACFIKAKLNGFYALAPRPASPASGGRKPPDQSAPINNTTNNATPRLERGPAAEPASGPDEAAGNPRDWPTYRHDAARSGYTATAIPAALVRSWQADLGGKLSSVVVAGGRVFVASKEDHTVYALDANDGTVCWKYTAGGRVDSPPTVSGGRALFGSADGWVYCLDAATGTLAWRFRAGPDERRIVVRGQLESTWPVPGSVLLRDGAVHFAAGRSSYLDGGIYLYRLDARTGQLRAETRCDSRDAKTGYQPKEAADMFDLPGLLPDVLSGDGDFLYLRHAGFDRQAGRRADGRTHLFCPTGFLDDTWWHRSYWIFGTQFYSGYRDWFRAGREVPAGRPLVFNQTSVYGFGRKPQYYYWSTPQEYHLFATRKQPELVDSPIKRARVPAWGQRQLKYTWSRDVPLLGRAMVLADTTLFVAGPPALLNEKETNQRRGGPAAKAKLKEQALALEGHKGGLLWAVSATDGSKLAEYQLDAPPAWDGMAAANGRLFLTTVAGQVVCWQGK